MIPSNSFPIFRQDPNPPPPTPEISPFDIELELLAQCTLGASWPSKDDITAVHYKNLLTLEDEQGRSLAHIILSHLASNERDAALINLFRYCPDLLKVSDPSGDTPLDILYGRHVNIRTILSAVYPGRHNFDAVSCLCYSKQAKDLICIYASKQDVNQNTVRSQDNPIAVCRELGKEDVMEVIYKLYPSSEKYGGVNPELATLLTWGDLISIETYLKNNEFEPSELMGCLDRLFQLGYDKNLIKKIITQSANSEFKNYNYSLDAKEFIFMFQHVPEMIERLPRDNELLFVTRECLKTADKKNHKHRDILTKLFDQLIEKNLFDSVYLNLEDYFLDDMITYGDLADKVIIEYAKQGFKEALFTIVCYSQVKNYSRPTKSFFDWIIPLFEKEKIPLQLIPSLKRPLLHKMAEDRTTDFLDLFKGIAKLVPREQITTLLHLRDANNFLPIDYLLSDPPLSEDESGIEPDFLNEILIFADENCCSQQYYKNLVFHVLLYGDEELHARFPLDKIDLDSLVMPEEYNCEYDSEFFEHDNCQSIERQRTFLEFMASLPQNIQTFLLSEQKNRTTIDVPIFPFFTESLLKNILESGDERMLQTFVTLRGKFLASDFIEFFTETAGDHCPKISLDLLQKAFNHLKTGNADYEYLFYDGDDNTTVLAEQAPEVIELMLNQFAGGTYNLERTNDLTKSFTEYTFKKLGVIYRDFAIFIRDGNICIANHEFEMTFEAITTQKAIDRAIDQHLQSKEITRFASIEELKKNELQAYSDILFQEVPPNPIPPICIVNLPKHQQFTIVCTDYSTGRQVPQYFLYAQNNVLEALLEFTKTKFQEQADRVNALQEAFPDYKVELFQNGRYTQFTKDGSTSPLHGIPSPEKAKFELEGRLNDKTCVIAAKEKGFLPRPIQTNGNFSSDVKNSPHNKCISGFTINRSIQALKLLSIRTPEKLSLMFCGGKDTLDSSIATIEAAHQYAINYETAKNMKFPKAHILIHDRKADVDFDRLNKLLLSYKESDYLNDYLKLNNTNYEVLSTALKNLVSSCTQGASIKDLVSADSQKVIIQLSHVLQKLERADEDQLRRFVCELALEANYCGWAISRKIATEYKTAFKLLQQDDSSNERTADSIFTDLYAQAILETFETMIKFVRHPRSQGQSIHVESYLRSILQHIMSLPPGDMHDQYLAGEDDYPRDEVAKYFEAFFVPILIQKLMTKQKEDNDAYQLLLQNFAELIPLPEGIFTEIEEQKIAKLADCEARLESANQELNELLISTNHTQNVSAYETVKSKIQALSTEWLSLNKNSEDIEQNVARPHKQRKISLLGKKEDFSLDQKRIDHQKEKINAELANLDEEHMRLKGLIGESFTEIEKLQNTIRKLKEEKHGILNSYRAQKKWKAEEIAEEQGLLATNEIDIPYLTVSGAIKLLELKNYIESKGL